MNVEAPDLGFFLLRDRALQWLGGSTRQKTDATQQEIHVGTDLKALVDKQGETIKKLQAELWDIKLSTSSVPVSSTPSRLCWTCNSPQNFQRNCPHFTGQSFGTPRWNGPFRQTGLPRHPDPTVMDHYSSFHITSVFRDPSVFLDANIWPEGSMVRWWCHKPVTPPVPLVCRLSRLMSTVCTPLCNTNGAYQNCQL